MNGYYNVNELKNIGFKKVGDNVLISKKASIYLPESISIGHNVRIDDFCFLVGDITLGNYIHIAPYSSIHGTGGGSVKVGDFVGISSYSTIYAATDDFSGKFLVGSVIDPAYTNVKHSNIVIEDYCNVALRSILLPGAYLSEGTVISAMSLLAIKTEPWYMYAGIPAKKAMPRKKEMIKMAKEVEERYNRINC